MFELKRFYNSLFESGEILVDFVNIHDDKIIQDSELISSIGHILIR